MIRITHPTRFTLGVTSSAMVLYDSTEPDNSCMWRIRGDKHGIIPGLLASAMEEVICEHGHGESLRAIVLDRIGGFDSGVIQGVLASFDVSCALASLKTQDAAGTRRQAGQVVPGLAHLLTYKGMTEAVMLAAHLGAEA